jgi:Domain of unknown function (DUF397)
MTTEPTWRTSSYSGEGNCVELGGEGGRVFVRDTKQADAGPMLAFSAPTWRRFARELKEP